MFSSELTIIENLKIYADILGAYCIKHAPLRYFEIPHDIWNEKVKNIDKETVNLAECGLIFYFRGKICMLHDVDDNTANLEKIKHLISARAESGNDIIIHTGSKIKVNSCIDINI